MRSILRHPLISWRHHEIPPAGYDAAVRRAREAGGPCDTACYTCACGYVFAAYVSTDVRCPHCGATQAW